jgi:hypothetical protein
MGNLMYREPKAVTEYYQRRPPRCCHTCDHFMLHNATCMKFNQVVPEQFAAEVDQCPEYTEIKVPF